MAYITKKEIIFQILLDNLTKAVYNIMSKIVSLCFEWRVCAAVLFPAVALASFTLAVPDRCEELLIVELGCVAQGGEVKLEIVFPRDESFCGFYGEILYDSGILCFDGIETDGESPIDGELSFADADGRLGILLDSSDTPFEGQVLVASFSLKEELSLPVCFELTSAEAYRWNEERLCRLDVPTASVELEPDLSQQSEVPQLLEFLSNDGEFIAFGRTPSGFFASGFEIVAVDVRAVEIYRITVAAVQSYNEGSFEFNRKLDLPKEGRFCVIIRPVAYKRDVVRYGDEVSFLLDNGKILGE